MLQVRDITKWFGDVKVLDRINFNINRGDRVGLIGPNGCGKTTLLKIITGELAPDRGSVQRSPADDPAGLSAAGARLPAGRHGGRCAPLGAGRARGGRNPAGPPG